MPLAETCWQSLREWLIAFGTVGATFAAVYVGAIRERRLRPKLSLHFDGGDQSDAQIVGTAGGNSAAYARLRVHNKKGRRAAEDVELIVWNTTVTRPSGNVHEKPPVSDMALAVSQSEPTTTKVNVAPGADRHVDFVHVDQGLSFLQLDVRPVPADSRHQIDAHEVEVELVLTARNADSRRYRVTVEWDGEFVPTAALWEEHFKIGKLRKV